MSPILERQDVIDKASIIENKERTKIYWEQLMIAAAKENNSSSKVRHWTVCDLRKSDSSCRRDCKLSSDVYAEDNMEKQTNCSYETEWESDLEFPNSKIRRQENSLEKERSRETVPLSMEGKIALELQEMKEREEELKEWRNKISMENCKDVSLPKDALITNGGEEMSSLHTTDDSNYSEYGSEEKEHSLDDSCSRGNTPYSEDFVHLRTQSLDSVSSGHSSGSGSTINERERERNSLRRKVRVRPYEDPDEEEYPCYNWDDKETPIEKEIRLAREREEELKREKGSAVVIESCRALGRKIKDKTKPKKEVLENDPRDIQHRLATSRIQQEIEEANERERELRTEGKIISTSEETLDSKVTRLEQLVENSIMESKYREQKMKRSSFHSLLSPVGDKRASGKIYENEEKQPSRTNCQKGKVAKRGVMQQFFSMRGKPFATGPIPQSPRSPLEFHRRPIVNQSIAATDDIIVHARKGYIPVADKIQEELMDNQKREEELRSQRARMLARSQPNLLELSDREDEERSTWKNREEKVAASPRLVHSLSNPNLLDDCFDKVHKRPSSKKFSLLEEWEKRIKENNCKE